MRQLFLTFATIISLALDAHTTSTESVILSAGWTFRQERLTAWHPATVPGTVHTDLMALGRIEDPFFGLNERTVQWIDKEDWLYDNYFEVTDCQQQRDRRELTFYGLDTYADVWAQSPTDDEPSPMRQVYSSELTVAANSSHEAWQMSVSQLLAQAGIPADETVIHAEFCGYANDYTLVAPKDLKLARPQLTWAIHDDSVTITTDRYARGIFLNLDGDASHHFSDNFFDLLPGQSRSVTLTTVLPSDQLERHLTATSY